MDAESFDGSVIDALYVQVQVRETPHSTLHNTNLLQRAEAQPMPRMWQTTEHTTLELTGLRTRCEDTVWIAVQAEVTREDPTTGTRFSDLAWTTGKGALATSPSQHWLSMPGCCAQNDDACTRSTGYWRTHHKYAKQAGNRHAWPIDEDTMLCGATWVELIQRAPRGDAWLILAQQWIAAHLNIATGVEAKPMLDHALNANAILACTVSLTNKDLVLEHAALLETFNRGEYGAPQCTAPSRVTPPSTPAAQTWSNHVEENAGPAPVSLFGPPESANENGPVEDGHTIDMDEGVRRSSETTDQKPRQEKGETSKSVDAKCLDIAVRILQSEEEEDSDSLQAEPVPAPLKTQVYAPRWQTDDESDE